MSGTDDKTRTDPIGAEESDTSALSHEEIVERIAKQIFIKYRKAFEELAKGPDD